MGSASAGAGGVAEGGSTGGSAATAATGAAGGASSATGTGPSPASGTHDNGWHEGNNPKGFTVDHPDNSQGNGNNHH